jgi:phage/plasmid primase-like uncharacterized protein
MADITHIFGGKIRTAALPITPVHEQFAEAMLDAGIMPPPDIIMDGQLHRFRNGSGRKNDHQKTGWYVAYADGIPTVTFGDWRTGVEMTHRADGGHQKWTPQQELEHLARVEQARAMRDAERQRKQATAASAVEVIWESGAVASPEHPYLARKRVQPHGARVTGDGRLMVPLFDDAGNLSSLQYIDAEGGKLYHPGGATQGRYWMLGTMDTPGPLYVAEGFATAATIHETTGRPCVASYSASNLVPVTGALRERHGLQQDIVIVADNDASGVGQKYADQASAKHGARVIVIPVPGDANDYVTGGQDLMALLTPAPFAENWLVPADDFCAQPAPIRWLVKGWLQEQALIMVHGPSGGGKTFVVLDWCLRMAAGVTDWQGCKVKPTSVVYLAGEGHHGLRSRVAAWKNHNNPAGRLNMWLSRSGCDLNTPQGYMQVVEHLRALPQPPQLIVVDTLHRFLAGDENSAQDAKTMLDACGGLMREFGAAVILVHHTGVSEGAQNRARGSSAWKGALDQEISIVPGEQIEIAQRKNKDAECAPSLYATLQVVEIPGWVDEDGEPVTSAVTIPASKEDEQPKTDSHLMQNFKVFENAWWASGAEMVDNAPYVSRAALRDKLLTDGRAERTVKNDLNASYTDRLIGSLILGEIITPKNHGWVVNNEFYANAMRLKRQAP